MKRTIIFLLIICSFACCTKIKNPFNDGGGKTTGCLPAYYVHPHPPYLNDTDIINCNSVRTWYGIFSYTHLGGDTLYFPSTGATARFIYYAHDDSLTQINLIYGTAYYTTWYRTP